MRAKRMQLSVRKIVIGFLFAALFGALAISLYRAISRPRPSNTSTSAQRSREGVCPSVEKILREAGWRRGVDNVSWLVAIDPRWNQHKLRDVLQIVIQIKDCVGASGENLSVYAWKGFSWHRDETTTKKVFADKRALPSSEVTTAQLMEGMFALVTGSRYPVLVLVAVPEENTGRQERSSSGEVRFGWHQNRLRLPLPSSPKDEQPQYAEVILLTPPILGALQSHNIPVEGEKVPVLGRFAEPFTRSLQLLWILLPLIALLALSVYQLVILKRQSRRMQESIFSIKKLLSDASQAAAMPQDAQIEGIMDKSLKEVIDDLRAERLRAIQEKQEWQDAMIRLFEAIENVTNLQGTDPKVQETYEQVFRVFSRLVGPVGLLVIRPARSEPFDERLHVIQSVVDDPTLPDMSIARCNQWGYSIQGKVVRKASVTVVRHSQDDSTHLRTLA